MKKYIFLFLFVCSFPCNSAYTANHSSTVSWVKIYNSDVIYFGLASMPLDHQCEGTFFALSPGLTEKQRDRYYSMLLTAKTTNSTVSVGYDKVTPDCFSTRPIAHALSF